ncbi:hypothetical protein PHYBOEH_008265 [Phytophthora boehmeriae]|uniref:Kinesin motor domain-containing protein n=1 Tax=Phytophthora boehmeriae TaxID=109152 RepID=A0A8T1W5G7_9STRA|nr:hypothetical protein PHYBOEH_008265 [Phytophthora boehmeriae]
MQRSAPAPRSGLKPPLPSVLRSTDCDNDSLDERSSSSTEDSRVARFDASDSRKDGSVQVAVRVRPMLPREIAKNAATCVGRPLGEDNCVSLSGGSLGGDRKFTFDHVFPQSANQTDLYAEALEPWMVSFLQGFNVTVIAYGQTGSGKTYTMGNAMPSTAMVANQLFAQSSAADDTNDDTLTDDEGLIPRFLHQLFAKLSERGGDYQLSVSFLEIYGEDIHDLLENSDQQRSSRRSEPLQLRENKKNGVWIQGLTEVRVTNRREAMDQMRRGSMQRITASTQMNERSSRSHAVYTVKIVQKVSASESKDNSGRSSNQSAGENRRSKAGFDPNANRNTSAGETPVPDSVVVSKLTFVDLAGSERLKKTHAEGERMKEGIQINVGLFALGNVINALGDEKRRASSSQVHVPYRSSKLTRLLQDALGGNSRTLFIACVSPAESNANETLNTLQYANRAKNIQNKAVKNIDSRTAELVSLKAFNQVLCRELIKAIFARLGAVTPADVDSLTETTMTNPKVVAYLTKIEQVAVSSGLESSSEERSFQTRRLLDGLTAYLYEMTPKSQFLRAPSLSSLNEDETRSAEPQDDFLDLISDSESSVAILEETKLDENAHIAARYSLDKLSRTLDIVNLAYELQENQDLEMRQREALNSKIVSLETQHHRKELIQDGMSAMVAKMKTWLASPACDQSERSLSVKRHVGHMIENMELMEIEMDELQRQKTALTNELKVEVKRYHKEWKAKHERIEQLRQVHDLAIDEASTNPLDILTRVSEIKVRFGSYDLDRISNFLEDEEKEMAAYVDEHDEPISYMSPLFTKEELSSAHAQEILSAIQDQLQSAFDREYLEASMSKELRNRSQLFQSISSGLMACHRGDTTEQEFMEKNEENIKDCEERIAQIRDAIRVKSEQRTMMSPILDSITSLDAAKSALRKLIAEVYALKRIYMVIAQEEEMRRRKQGGEQPDSNVWVTKAEMNEKIEELDANYEKDVRCAFQMVTSFNDTVGKGALIEQEDSVMAGKQVETMNKLAALEDREKQLTTQLADKDEEMIRMRVELARLQSSLKNEEMKEESFRLMNKCQEIWKELGMDEDYQASKFQDINELLVKKCSEELEGLEAAREKLQARVNDAFGVVSRLESVLSAEDPVAIENITSVAGETLLKQEKYLLTRKKRLSEELLRRLNAHVRTVDGIRELVAGLQVESSEDFRCAPNDKVDNINAALKRSATTHLISMKEYQQDPESSSSLENLLQNFDDVTAASLSNSSMQQDKMLFNALLKEKAIRIAELEESLGAIRAIAQKTQLSHEDIVSVLRELRDTEDPLDNGIGANQVDRYEELADWILQKGGQLDVSKRGLDILAKSLRCFKEIYAGRVNAVDFTNQTLEEAAMLTQDITAGYGGSSTEQHQLVLPLAHIPRKLSCGNGDFYSRDTLSAGKKAIESLSVPVIKLLRSLFYSMNDDFGAFGIDTSDQRISFFLGRNDEGHQARREILKKYAVFSSDDDEEIPVLHPECNDSLLSQLDPAFEAFHRTYSLSYGGIQLQRLRDSILDMTEVQNTVKSAQNRLQSLQKIMKLFNQINEFKAKIGEFEASASQKNRLFGNSLRLLEEERFRKMAAKRYPNLLAALRKEVTRWLENEDGEYDLSMLGEDLKSLLLDMMNTDTGLMHLDLGVVDHARRSSKTLTPNSSSTNLAATANSNGNRTTSSAKARPQTQTAHPRNSHARALNFD